MKNGNAGATLESRNTEELGEFAAAFAIYSSLVTITEKLGLNICLCRQDGLRLQRVENILFINSQMLNRNPAGNASLMQELDRFISTYQPGMI